MQLAERTTVPHSQHPQPLSRQQLIELSQQLVSRLPESPRPPRSEGLGREGFRASKFRTQKMSGYGERFCRLFEKDALG